MKIKRVWSHLAGALCALAALLAGCASTVADAEAEPDPWKNRVGQYKFSDAVGDYGPPDGQEKRADGSVIAHWTNKARTLRKPSIQRWDPDFGPGGLARKGRAETMAGVVPAHVLRLEFGPDQRLKTANRQFR